MAFGDNDVCRGPVNVAVITLWSVSTSMAKFKITKPELSVGEALNLLNPNQLAWERFEDEVAAHFEREIERKSLGWIPEFCHVIQKPEYYSKARESNITFDVSVELRPNKDDENASHIWIIECKDYPNRSVPVDEVEEFVEKIRQVGAHKGTIVTRKGFQSGGITVAKTYRIGLMTLNKCISFDIQLSEDSKTDLDVALMSPMAIGSDGNQYDGDLIYLSQIIDNEIHSLRSNQNA